VPPSEAKAWHMPSPARFPTSCPRPGDGTKQESTPRCESVSGGGGKGAVSLTIPQYHLQWSRHDGTGPVKAMVHPEAARSGA
jgi:hypothetical protein